MGHRLFFGVLLINLIWVQQDIKRQVCVSSGIYETKSEVEPFMPGIISASGSYFGTGFLPDGNTVYFASVDTVKHKSMIMKSGFENGKWSLPLQVEFSGEYFEGDPFISCDGSKIFFFSKRPLDTSKIPA